MENHKKNSKCVACEKQTFGVFNRAVKLIKKISAKDSLIRREENGLFCREIGTNKNAAVAPKFTKRGSWE